MGAGSVFLAPDATLDLHLHTRASDGRWTPDTLVEKAAALGLRVMAVADHDTVDSVAPVAELAAGRGIATISGVEVTTRWDGRQWHVLIYGADLDGTAFRALVDESRRRHVEAAERAVAGLRAKDYHVPSLAEAIDGRPPLPIYVMSALVRDGHAATLEEANRLVTERLGVPFYIDVPLREAVDTAHAAGGLAVLAHPGRFEPEPITAERLARLLSEAKDLGAPLDGLEVYYPTHTPEQVAFYARLADEHGLLRTCGSDSHGPGLPRDPIPYLVGPVAPFLERCGFHIVARR